MDFQFILYRSSQCSCLQPGANWRHSARCSKSIYRCSCHSGGNFAKLPVCRQSCQKNATSRIYVFLIGSPSPHGDWCLHPRTWFLTPTELMLECRTVVAIKVISTVRTYTSAMLYNGTKNSFGFNSVLLPRGQTAETVDFRPKAGTTVQATARNRTVLRLVP